MNNTIPQYTIDALNRYVNDRILPGSFLTNVLINDLFGAIAQADSLNLKALPEIVRYIYNELPSDAWGNRDIVWKYVENTFYKKVME